MITIFSKIHFKEVCELLISAHKHDTLTVSLLQEKIFDDPDQTPTHKIVFMENNLICGFMQGVVRQIKGENIGYIKLMAVKENYRKKGIATKMFHNLSETFAKQNVTKIKIYDTPLNYLQPGINPCYTPAVCFAQKHGFKHIGDAVNMTVCLEQNFLVETEIFNLKKENIEIVRAEIADKEELMTFVAQEWLLWLFEMEMTFLSNPVSLFIAKKDGKIKAFSAYDANNKGTAWFGPMGTHHDLRGKGIGTILLKLCLNEMKKQGHKTATIPWVAPISFYSHFVKAEINTVFWRFEKIVS